jgi:hypothetical protein
MTDRSRSTRTEHNVPSVTLDSSSHALLLADAVVNLVLGIGFIERFHRLRR